MSTTKPEALRLAAWLKEGAWQKMRLGDVEAAGRELLRQHAEIAHADRYAEQLGRELAKATAEIADLRAQLAAIGAGGVSPLMGAAGDAASEPAKRDLRSQLQQQCSTWGAYWRASDSHGVELTHAQAVELLESALGVEVEVKPIGCQTCDDTGMIGGPSYYDPGEGGVPCPDCAHLSPPEGAAGDAGWKPIETAPKDGLTVILGRDMGDFGFVRGYGRFTGKPGAFISGWISQGFSEFTGNLGLAHPTHWRPLPPAPPYSAKGVAHG